MTIDYFRERRKESNNVQMLLEPQGGGGGGSSSGAARSAGGSRAARNATTAQTGAIYRPMAGGGSGGGGGGNGSSRIPSHVSPPQLAAYQPTGSFSYGVSLLSFFSHIPEVILDRFRFRNIFFSFFLLLLLHIWKECYRKMLVADPRARLFSLSCGLKHQMLLGADIL